jgi:hypothetical protein
MLPGNVLEGLRSWFVTVFAKAVSFFPSHSCEHFTAEFLDRNAELRVCTNLESVFAFLKLWEGLIMVVLIEKLLLLPALFEEVRGKKAFPDKGHFERLGHNY